MTNTTFNNIFKSSKNTVSIDFDDWDIEPNLCSEIKMEQPTIEYEKDPLAVVLWYKHKNKNQYVDIFFLLKDPNEIDFNVPDEFLEQAERIRAYYRNKLMFRRLKGNHMSSFMSSLESIVDDSLRLRESDFPIIAKMHDFYKEDTCTDEILKGKKPLKSKLRGTTHIRSYFKFVGSVERKSRHQKLIKYYFSNEQDEILSVDVRQNEMSYPLFEYLTKSKEKIGIDATVDIHNIVGRSFNCWHLGTSFEIFDTKS